MEKRKGDGSSAIFHSRRGNNPDMKMARRREEAHLPEQMGLFWGIFQTGFIEYCDTKNRRKPCLLGGIFGVGCIF